MNAHILSFIQKDTNDLLNWRAGYSLLKSYAHRSTNAMIDVLHSSNVFPLITEPTAATDKTATLIDHILANFDIHTSHMQKDLCNFISNQYFFLTVCHTMTNNTASIKRNMSPINIMRFINEVKNQNWQFVLNEIESQTAYNRLHEMISSKYSGYFPYRKIAKKNIIEINPGCQLHPRNQSNENNYMLLATMWVYCFRMPLYMWGYVFLVCPFSVWWLREYIYLVYYPLFRVRSWNNGVRCMSFCILIGTN